MKQRILVVGHGVAGRTLASDITLSGGEVVGFLDDRSDDPAVLGTLQGVNEVIGVHRVDLVYFAIPSVDAKTVRDFISTIESDSVEIAIIPRTFDIITKETVDINDLTDIDVLDLVGRSPVKHDVVSSRNFISGKRVLVTGAAGSIGSRLARQIVAMNPESLTCVDWWENGMFYLSQDLGQREAVTFQIADIKNRARMDQIFAEARPDIVFHAAAYKHVPLMQGNPIEAFNNNVGGSLNLMQLSIEHRAKHFVYVSTDKAVNPVNVMGATKRIGEMVLESLADATHGTKFNAVRFGNVIESNGSVMEIFRDQIRRRSPLTVTHPEVTRYFMTIDEAAQLIIQSALLGEDSEIFVLDMGDPVRILDLAKSLVRAVDPSLSIELTGLRPGEKMFEELSYEPDKVAKTSHASIFAAKDAQDFDHADLLADVERILTATMTYEATSDSIIGELRAMGFAIQ